MTTSLSPAAKLFAEQGAELDAARALVGGLTAPEGLALIAYLTGKRERLHLEALGEVATNKDVRKAARQAAYKLKSAGVAGGTLARPAGIDMTVAVELDKTCMVVAPGLDGHTWMVFAGLPGAGGGEIDVRSREKGPRLEVIEDLAVGRLKKVWAEVAADARLQKPILVHAKVGARLIRRFAETLGRELKGGLPPKLTHFLAWADRAEALGANPAEAAARGRVTPVAGPMNEAKFNQLASHPLVGYLAPAETALDVIEVAFKPLMHSDAAISEADFRLKLEGLVDDAADKWAADPVARANAGAWLEDTADVLLAAGEEALAALALGVADDLAAYTGVGRDMPLARFAFSQAVDAEGAWAHRQAHMRGEAHHAHDEGHDHGDHGDHGGHDHG